MKAVVTGGAGFIGHHLVNGLLERGDDVVVLDDYSAGRRDRLAGGSDRLSLVEGSVLDPQALNSAFAECEVVFHEAAVVSVARSMSDPQRIVDVNEGGTVQVMLAAARNGVRRVVFAGSAAVYGHSDGDPCREEQRPDPRSPYGVSKLSAELYVHVLGHIHGVETVVLRYFNVFGPGQDPASEYAAVIPRFIATVVNGERPVINGSGGITRDFVYVADVVRANMLAARASTPSGVTCNVASGVPTTLNDLVQAVGAAAGRQVDPSVGPPRPGDVTHSLADVSLARRILAFDAETSLGEGIARSMDWFRGDAP